MTQERISQLYAAFRTLPEEVKDRISSDEAHEILADLARTLVLSDAQALGLPLLILRLTVQDLAPESFKAEAMQELGMDSGLAERITDDVRGKILAPVAQPLMFGGVDITRLGLDAAATTAEPMPHAPPVAHEIFPSAFPAINPNSPPPAEPVPAAAPTADVPAPFILHEEITSSRYAQRAPAEAVTASRPAAERIVHYNRLYTPLNHPRNAHGESHASPRLRGLSGGYS